MSLADNGTLVYAPADTSRARLMHVSPTGMAAPLSDEVRHYGHPRVSPDGRRVVVEQAGESLWIHDVTRDARTALTPGPIPGASFPIWTPDGRWVIFRRMDELYAIEASGTAAARQIPNSVFGDIPVAVAPDGDTLAVLRTTPGTGGDIFALSLSGRTPARPLVRTPGYDGGADFSPDGRLMVYASTDSGASQVYLTTFPAVDRKWSISTRGGTQPRFARSGRQIFYRDESRMMAVDVAMASGEVKLSAPRMLFDANFSAGALVTIANYDVTSDGGFVMMRAEPGVPRIAVVLN